MWLLDQLLSLVSRDLFDKHLEDQVGVLMDVNVRGDICPLPRLFLGGQVFKMPSKQFAG